MRVRKGDWLQTISGRAFYPLDPRADELDIGDIANGLSMQCRYTGQVKEFYSIAEHCCHISDHCSSENKLWGLLHDASEAYINDIARPIKPALTGYKAIETGIMYCVAERYGLSWPMPREVKELDTRILVNEDQIRAKPPMPWTHESERIPGLTLACWDWRQAKAEFLGRFVRLYR